ncbi:hypothetical protein PIN31115_04445 [Pandoraea iniqua]|uniref:Uncharacterized protein n=1 Tax=Pandoraea iniqua TaxID=2508288 RepID=A0A5E4YEW7_9BURK|nr:hypothetical protein [Pandoraea iniqua]VVE47040.1 hypothetical protein PIN31115_04445 [Pandoraea iniqua]
MEPLQKSPTSPSFSSTAAPPLPEIQAQIGGHDASMEGAQFTSDTKACDHARKSSGITHAFQCLVGRGKQGGSAELQPRGSGQSKPHAWLTGELDRWVDTLVQSQDDPTSENEALQKRQRMSGAISARLTANPSINFAKTPLVDGTDPRFADLGGQSDVDLIDHFTDLMQIVSMSYSEHRIAKFKLTPNVVFQVRTYPENSTLTARLACIDYLLGAWQVKTTALGVPLPAPQTELRQPAAKYIMDRLIGNKNGAKIHLDLTPYGMRIPGVVGLPRYADPASELSEIISESLGQQLEFTVESSRRMRDLEGRTPIAGKLSPNERAKLGSLYETRMNQHLDAWKSASNGSNEQRQNAVAHIHEVIQRMLSEPNNRDVGKFNFFGMRLTTLPELGEIHYMLSQNYHIAPIKEVIVDRMTFSHGRPVWISLYDRQKTTMSLPTGQVVEIVRFLANPLFNDE